MPEHRDRDLEVPVLLHVEVDEGRPVGCCLLEQGRQRLDNVGDPCIECPVCVRSMGRGHFDRYMVYVRAGHQLLGACQPTRCFTIAEHGFAEQVEVELSSVSS
jgi:hypothetical protein